jgi:hypothetical protein
VARVQEPQELQPEEPLAYQLVAVQPAELV